MENTHPFQQDSYIFCHNGTVKEQLPINGEFKPQGETDSELLFLYLLSNSPDGINETVIYDNYNKIKDYKGMNSFITNGNESYIVNWYSFKPNYYTYKYLATNDFVVFSSEKLPHFKGDWKKTQNRDVVKLNTETHEYQIYSFN